MERQVIPHCNLLTTRLLATLDVAQFQILN